MGFLNGTLGTTNGPFLIINMYIYIIYNICIYIYIIIIIIIIIVIIITIIIIIFRYNWRNINTQLWLLWSVLVLLTILVLINSPFWGYQLNWTEPGACFLIHSWMMISRALQWYLTNTLLAILQDCTILYARLNWGWGGTGAVPHLMTCLKCCTETWKIEHAESCDARGRPHSTKTGKWWPMKLLGSTRCHSC